MAFPEVSAIISVALIIIYVLNASLQECYLMKTLNRFDNKSNRNYFTGKPFIVHLPVGLVQVNRYVYVNLRNSIIASYFSCHVAGLLQHKGASNMAI